MDRGKIRSAVLFAGCGAAALAVIGFTWGGWVGSQKAQFIADEAAVNAVTDRLASICVFQSGQDPEKARKLVEFGKIDTWNRGDFVAEQGWATMIGEKEPESRVSRKCAELISQGIG